MLLFKFIIFLNKLNILAELKREKERWTEGEKCIIHSSVGFRFFFKSHFKSWRQSRAINGSLKILGCKSNHFLPSFLLMLGSTSLTIILRLSCKKTIQRSFSYLEARFWEGESPAKLFFSKEVGTHRGSKTGGQGKDRSIYVDLHPLISSRWATSC